MNIRFRVRILNVLFTFCAVAISVSAEGQNSSDTLQGQHRESVTVYGTSRPVIQHAYQKFFRPADFTIPNSSVNYFEPVNPGILITKLGLQKIKPQAIDTYIPVENWNNLAKGGLGSRISPYAELFHSQGKKDSYRWNVHLFHYSSFLNIKNYLPSPYTNTLAETSLKKFFSYHLFSFGAKYQINSLRYYGYHTLNDTLNFNKNNNELKQLYQLGAFNLSFGDTYRSFEKLHYRFTGTGYYFTDRFNMRESHAAVSIDVHKAFDVTNIFNHQQVGLEADYLFYNEKNPYQERKDNFIKAMPYIDARYGIISFKAGVKIEWLQNLGRKLYAYPYLKAQMEIIPNAFSIFAAVDGGLNKNSYYGLVTKNPFLYSFDSSYRWEKNKFLFHAGFEGNFAKRLGFEMEAGVQYFENKPFFDYSWSNSYRLPAADSVLQYVKNAFYVTYADGNLFYLSGGISYENSPNIKTWLTAKYQEFSLKNNMKPLYEPNLEIKWGASIQFSKKVRGWSEIYYSGKRWASERLIAGGSVISNPYYQLPGYININMGGNYQIDKQFSAFLKVSNLLNRQYQIFNDYPVAGIEMMLGVSYRF